MRAPQFLQRLVALVRGLTDRDWRGWPGKVFRKGIKKVGEKSDDYRLKERAEQTKKLGWQRLEGEAWQKRNEAIVNEAKAEAIRTETELKRRAHEHEMRRLDAESSRAEAEAFKALVQGLNEAGIAFRVTEEGKLQVLPSDDTPPLLESDDPPDS